MEQEKLIKYLKREEVRLTDRLILFGGSLVPLVAINVIDHHPATLVTTALFSIGGQLFYGRECVLWGKKTVLEFMVPQGAEEALTTAHRIVGAIAEEQASYKDQSLLAKMKRARYLFDQENAPAGLFERVPEGTLQVVSAVPKGVPLELNAKTISLLYETGQISEEETLALLDRLNFDETEELEDEGDCPLGNYPGLPPLSIFETGANTPPLTRSSCHEIEQRLSDALRGFGVQAHVDPEATKIGPRILQFGIVPLGIPVMEGKKPKLDESGKVIYTKRTRISDITKCEKDIQLALGAQTIRMLPPVPGKHYVGVEIPNPCDTPVLIADILSSREYQQALASSKLVFALGRDVAGTAHFCDLARAPHILIAGATGAGKSVLINVLIGSLLTQATPDEVRLLMIDPKQVELTPYNGIAHLLAPVVTDMRQVAPLLKRAIAEMERRYSLFSKLGVRHLEGYRSKQEQNPSLENLPVWVIIIDELADLMMTTPDSDRKGPGVEELICRLAQKARAIGIHLVVATQRPSVDVITGLIKANIPTRISFMVSSATDSRTILDMGGAERLLGRGDMLYRPADARPERIQGAFMTDTNATSLAGYWQTDRGQEYDDGSLEENLYLDCEDSTILDGSQGMLRYNPLRCDEETNEASDDDRYGSGDEAPQNGPKLADSEPCHPTRNDRKGERETARDGAVRGQNETVLPHGWTKLQVEMLPGFYEGFESLDKALKALKLPTSQRNRDFARDILKKLGLWKGK